MPIVCKHCGAEDGFYVKERVTGIATIYYDNKGDYGEDQSAMYDYLSHSGGKKAYCQNCKKHIGKSEDLISGKTEKSH